MAISKDRLNITGANRDPSKLKSYATASEAGKFNSKDITNQVDRQVTDLFNNKNIFAKQDSMDAVKGKLLESISDPIQKHDDKNRTLSKKLSDSKSTLVSDVISKNSNKVGGDISVKNSIVKLATGSDGTCSIGGLVSNIAPELVEGILASEKTVAGLVAKIESLGIDMNVVNMGLWLITNIKNISPKTLIPTFIDDLIMLNDKLHLSDKILKELVNMNALGVAKCAAETVDDAKGVISKFEKYNNVVKGHVESLEVIKKDDNDKLKNSYNKSARSTKPDNNKIKEGASIPKMSNSDILSTLAISALKR